MSMRVVSRSASTESGGLSVTIDGPAKRHKLSVGSWDWIPQVYTHSSDVT